MKYRAEITFEASNEAEAELAFESMLETFCNQPTMKRLDASIYQPISEDEKWWRKVGVYGKKAVSDS